MLSLFGRRPIIYLGILGSLKQVISIEFNGLLKKKKKKKMSSTLLELDALWRWLTKLLYYVIYVVSEEKVLLW